MKKEEKKWATGTLAFIIGYFSTSVRASAHRKPGFFSHPIGA